MHACAKWRQPGAAARCHAVPGHPIPRFSAGADLGRAVCHPLVRARLYLRHPARLALCPHSHPARSTVGRQAAVHGRRLRRLHRLGDAWHRARRPHRLCAVLQPAAVRRSSARDFRGLEGRHVVPRRVYRLRPRRHPLRLPPRHLDPVARRRDLRGRADRALPRPAGKLRERRTVGAANRRAVGYGISRTGDRFPVIRASFTKRRSRGWSC